MEITRPHFFYQLSLYLTEPHNTLQLQERHDKNESIVVKEGNEILLVKGGNEMLFLKEGPEVTMPTKRSEVETWLREKANVENWEKFTKKWKGSDRNRMRKVKSCH